MKVLYVLIADGNNFFAEQCYLSIKSLKKYNSNVSVARLTDEDTFRYISDSAKYVLEEVDDIITHQFRDNYSAAYRSRFLKTSMRLMVPGDFLFVDSDTIICDSLEDATILDKSAAVADNHSSVTPKIVEFGNVIARANKYGYSVGYNNIHLNTGVIWCKDDSKTYDFFRNWHELWLLTYENGVVIDQLSFNEINQRMNGVIQEIDGVWNCQLRYGIKYLAKSKIIHYFASNPRKNRTKNFAYFFEDVSVWRSVKDNKGLTEEVLEALDNPRGAFSLARIVEVGTDNYYAITSVFGAMARFWFRHRLKTNSNISGV